MIAETRWPWFAAAICGAGVAIFHEFFDFSLRTPANAFLLCLMLAVAVRIAASAGAGRSAVRVAKSRMFAWAASGAVVAVLFSYAAATQHPTIYPDYATPNTAKDARDLVLRHPANSKAHVILAGFDTFEKNGMTHWAICSNSRSRYGSIRRIRTAAISMRAC